MLLYLPSLCGEGGGRRGGNGVTLHVESALYSDIAPEVRDLTKSRSRNRHALLSSEFNSKPKVKNTFEHPTREGKCVGTPANGLQKKEEKLSHPTYPTASQENSAGVVLIKHNGIIA